MATVSGTFTDVGVSASIRIRKGDRYTLSVTGTFVQKLDLEFSDNGGASYVPIRDLSNGFTSATLVADREGLYRFRCREDTSGTSTYSLADAAGVLDEFVDGNGNPVFRMVEGGVEFPGTVGDMRLPDDNEIQLGSASGGDAVLLFSDADASNHATVLGLDDTSQQLHVTDKGAKATDWNRAAGTHPEVAIHSNTTPATDYLAIGNHDGSAASVDVVGGTELALKIAGNTEVSVKADSLELPVDTVLSILGSGVSTGDVVARFGASATEGLEVVVYEDTVSPAAIETNLINIPANSRILSVQSNVETALTGGGTTDSYGIGTAGDPDKYGSSATLTQNSKSDFLGDGTVLSASEQLVLTGTASETADGDTALTVGSVRVRVVYLTLNSLDDA